MFRAPSHTRALQALAFVAASAGLAACDRLVDPPLPSDAQQFTPPLVYSTWWKMTEACSGVTGDFEAVSWFKSSEVLHDPNTGDPIIGYWSAATNRIVLTNTAVLSGQSVRHEMLHALIRTGGHPRAQFLGNCAGVVHCEDSCITDGGPYPKPPQSPIEVPGDSIEITMDVDPGTPAPVSNDGFFSITVKARNRTAHWATVIPGGPALGVTHTFSFDVRGPAGGILGADNAADPSQMIFAPGETKRQVFDFSIGHDLNANKLPPGNYIARGWYADHISRESTFVIDP